MIDSARIAKNTGFLYARLLIVLGVMFYTSRVVLDKLGTDNYALYTVVFSVIGLLSFLNGTLSSGTSRFITYDLGTGDTGKLKRTFSTALSAHIILSLIILLLGETIGVWYVYNVMECPAERFHSAFVTYQISIAVTMVSIIQVPFTSEIMAHEKMDIYAYIGLFEAFAKLAIVYLLGKSNIDKLILYAFLILAVTVVVFLMNMLYARHNFEEVRFEVQFDKPTFKSIMTFSGWNIVANLSNSLMTQGLTMLFNIFFLPVVVAAQGLAGQISKTMMKFVDNVRQAVNPQVIKLYADARYEESKKLTLQSAEYIFYLLMAIGVPLIMIMPNLLDIWLVEVPDYTAVFARFIILQDILGNFSSAFYTPMVAANKIKKNSMSAVVLCLSQFGILYVLFRCGMGPIWARYTGILFCMIWSFVVKPYILWKDLDYTLGEMGRCIGKCMSALAAVAAVCAVIYYLIPQTTFMVSIMVAALSLAVVLVVDCLFIPASTKKLLIKFIKSKLCPGK